MVYIVGIPTVSAYRSNKLRRESVKSTKWQNFVDNHQDVNSCHISSPIFNNTLWNSVSARFSFWTKFTWMEL